MTLASRQARGVPPAAASFESSFEGQESPLRWRLFTAHVQMAWRAPHEVDPLRDHTGDADVGAAIRRHPSDNDFGDGRSATGGRQPAFPDSGVRGPRRCAEPLGRRRLGGLPLGRHRRRRGLVRDRCGSEHGVARPSRQRARRRGLAVPNLHSARLGVPHDDNHIAPKWRHLHVHGGAASVGARPANVRGQGGGAVERAQLGRHGRAVAAGTVHEKGERAGRGLVPVAKEGR
mmetsp:Transcript_19278/g.73846  ORF Transcript_19278/g.73846 Transcript_19278/m.73846 type:complete len:232 (+) Transcript_19278:2240-2935(+)